MDWTLDSLYSTNESLTVRLSALPYILTPGFSFPPKVKSTAQIASNCGPGYAAAAPLALPIAAAAQPPGLWFRSQATKLVVSV